MLIKKNIESTTMEKDIETVHDKFNFKKLKINIPANMIINFSLSIVPKELKKYYFKLPVYLNNYGIIPG